MPATDAGGPVADGGPQTLADLAYEQLEHLIVTLALLPGDVISESRVVARLGLGRTPVREALLRLRQTRLIEPGPGRSHVVTPLNFSESLQVTEVARRVEGLMVERAAAERTSLEARRFAALAQAFIDAASAEDMAAYLVAHAALNGLIAESARQPVAARTMAPLIPLGRRLVVANLRVRGMMLAELAPAHAALAQALADGRPAEAASALGRLQDRWVEIIESLAATAAVNDLTALLRAAP